MPECSYAIVPTDDVTAEVLAACVEERVEDLRKSLDGTLSVVKWHGPKPAVLEAYTELSRAEILDELTSAAWTDLTSP